MVDLTQRVSRLEASVISGAGLAANYHRVEGDTGTSETGGMPGRGTEVPGRSELWLKLIPAEPTGPLDARVANAAIVLENALMVVLAGQVGVEDAFEGAGEETDDQGLTLEQRLYHCQRGANGLLNWHTGFGYHVPNGLELLHAALRECRLAF